MNSTLQFNPAAHQLTGPAGSLAIAPDDKLARRFLMLLEGQCLQENIVTVVQKYGYCRQRYYQLLAAFQHDGLAALQPKKTGPKSNYRRTEQVVRQVLRYIFLDTDASAQVVAQKLRQTHFSISLRSVRRIIADYGLQKKLYAFNPTRKEPVPKLSVQSTRKHERLAHGDPLSVERGVRQLLADKVSGTLLGIFLLVPEHLRLGTWDLLRTWSGDLTGQTLAPRLGLHLVHEAALCRPSLRYSRSLRHKGFELATGLPFLPTDRAIHELLQAHTMEQAHQLQIRLGQLRRASGAFPAQVLALDPHRQISYSKREMVARRPSASQPASKQAQSFFLLDAQTSQPLCLTHASSAQTIATATAQLLQMAQAILGSTAGSAPLIVADVEHFSTELLDLVRRDTPFDLLVPLRSTKALRQHYGKIAPELFTRHWAGFATTVETFQPVGSTLAEPCYRFVQRTGEDPDHYHFKGFACTAQRAEVPALTCDFPDRWHIEEFFRFDQDLGWKRAGTLNLHIRLAQMSLALLAQALIHQLRQRLGAPCQQWDSPHFARDFFAGLEGDLRVEADTIIVTYYNAPGAAEWKRHFENLPKQLEQEKVDPRIPWLYNFKLDFRFR